MVACTAALLLAGALLWRLLTRKRVFLVDYTVYRAPDRCARLCAGGAGAPAVELRTPAGPHGARRRAAAAGRAHRGALRRRPPKARTAGGATAFDPSRGGCGGRGGCYCRCGGAPVELPRVAAWERLAGEAEATTGRRRVP